MSEIIVNISQTEELVTLNVVPVDNPITLNVVEDVTLVTLNVNTGLGSGTGNASNTETIIAGENLVINNLVYLATDGKWYKTDYLTESKISTEVRIVKNNIAINTLGEAYIFGLVTTTGLTAGERYSVGANGTIILESSIPDTEGIFIRYIGTAKSTTELEFYPDADYYETTLVSGGTTSNTSIVSEITVTEDIIEFSLVNVDGSKADSSIVGKRNWALGVNKTTILNGFSGEIVTSGQIVNPSWSFTSGDQLYLNGTSISSTPPSTGFSQKIGNAINSTIVNINIKEGILI